MKQKLILNISIIVVMAWITACNQASRTDQSTMLENDTAPAAAEQPIENQKIHLSAQTDDDDGTVTLSLTDEDALPAADQEISVLFSKGTTAYANEDFATGVTYFEQIVRENPQNRKAYYNLGVGYAKLQKFSEALNAYTKAIEIIPNDALSLQSRGRVYFIMGKYEKAFEDYDRVLKMKDSDAVSWYNRGTAYGAMKLYSKAKEDFDKAIELDPDYSLAYYNRGLAHFHLGMRHDACVDWRKALSLGHYEADKALGAYCEDN